MADPSPSPATPPSGASGLPAASGGPEAGGAAAVGGWQGPALGDVLFGRRAGREPSVRSILRIIVTVVGSALALYIVYRLRTPISYLLFATFIAVALSAPVAWLTQRMPKGLAILIVYLAVVLVPVGVGAILIPPLVQAAADLVGDFPSYVDDLKGTVNENETLQNLNDDFDVTSKLEEFAGDAASKLTDVPGVLADVGAGIVGSIFAGVTILIMSLFMVSRGGKWIDMVLGTRPPREAEVIKRALDNMSVAVGAYVGGAILQSLIAGVVTFIVLSILGVPAPLALAVLVAVLDLIPLVGATLGAILVAIVTLFVDFPTVTIIWVDLGDRLPAVRELRDPAPDPGANGPARPVHHRHRGPVRRHPDRDRRRPRCDPGRRRGPDRRARVHRLPQGGAARPAGRGRGRGRGLGAASGRRAAGRRRAARCGGRAGARLSR